MAAALALAALVLPTAPTAADDAVASASTPGMRAALPADAAVEPALKLDREARWPHCPVFFYTIDPPAYQFTPSCLFPLPIGP